MGKKEKSILEHKAISRKKLTLNLNNYVTRNGRLSNFKSLPANLGVLLVSCIIRMDDVSRSDAKARGHWGEAEGDKAGGEAIKDGEAAEKEMVKVTKKRDAEMSKGGRLKQL